MAIEWESPMRWDNTGNEPSENLQTNGFSGGYKPPATVFNYFLHKVYLCLQQLQNIVGQHDSKQAQMDEALTNFDCGYFEENTRLLVHMADAAAHENLSVDGNSVVVPTTGDTLAEHEVDSAAHSNIVLDGNET